MTTSVGTPVGDNLQGKPKRDDIHSGIQNILLKNKETREMSVPTADKTFFNFAVKVFPYFSYLLPKPEKVFAAGSTAREKISNKF